MRLAFCEIIIGTSHDRLIIRYSNTWQITNYWHTAVYCLSESQQYIMYECSCNTTNTISRSHTTSLPSLLYYSYCCFADFQSSIVPRLKRLPKPNQAVSGSSHQDLAGATRFGTAVIFLLLLRRDLSFKNEKSAWRVDVLLYDVILGGCNGHHHSILVHKHDILLLYRRTPA